MRCLLFPGDGRDGTAGSVLALQVTGVRITSRLPLQEGMALRVELMARTHALPITVERAVVTGDVAEPNSEGTGRTSTLRFETMSKRDRIRLAEVLTAGTRPSSDRKRGPTSR